MTDYLVAMHNFIAEGLLPKDTEVISTHNNLVVASASAKIVSRIAQISLMEQKIDPGDIRYSHKIAWLLGESTSVLRPVAEMPYQHGDFVFSTFPFLSPVRWDAQDPVTILNAISELGQALRLVRHIELRRLNIEEYAKERLEHARSRGISEKVLEWAEATFTYYQQHHAFLRMVELDSALVHGDLHAGNAVEDHDGRALFIDLDSIAIGPRLYDLASWRVRRELGDQAPVEEMVAKARYLSLWNEEQFCALVGWKLLSSVTHILRYAEVTEVRKRLRTLDLCGVTLMAPGPWGNFTEGE